MQHGRDVKNLGVAPTPVCFRSVREAKDAAGIVVTASHNPVDWNGLKFIVRTGMGPSIRQLDNLNRFLGKSIRPPKKSGRYLRGESGYVKSVMNLLGEPITSNMRVVVDTGGGAAGSTVFKLLSMMNFTVISVHATEGIFNREPDPVQDDLTLARRLVVAENCDVGLAYDPDGDRLVLIDEKGAKLPPDCTLAIGLKLLKERINIHSVALSVDTSRTVLDVAKSLGLNIHYAPVGERNVVEVMLRKRCSVGGEGSSGGLIAGEFNWCRDGIMTAAMILNGLNGRKLSEVRQQLNQYHTIRKKLPIRRKIIQSCMKRLRKMHPEASTLDGLRLEPDEESYVLIRPSNTEEVLRISVESSTMRKAERLMARFMNQVKA
jgi:phosphoglucosamine mutase/phosphomannomutase/phosphoglucomutase